MKKTEIEFSTTAEHSIKELRRNIRERQGKDVADDFSVSLVKSIIERLSAHPLSCPPSSQAAELGVLQYREYVKDGFRVFYEYFPEEDLVVVGLVISDRQSLERLLVKYCLLWTPS